MSNQDKDLVCERCCSETDKLYPFPQKDDFGEIQTKMICWSCDHDVTNGGDLFADASEVMFDRMENAYAYDPINNPNPNEIQKQGSVD